MKYIFLVNHLFMENMANHIISEKKLNKEDCYFIYVRINSCSSCVSEIKLNVEKLFNMSLRHCLWLYCSILNLRKTIDARILTSDYILFTYHTGCAIAQSIINHERCIGYYIVEEGLGSYMPSYTKKAGLSWFRRFIFIMVTFGNVGLVGRYRYNTKHIKYHGIIASNMSAFPTIQNKIVIGLPFKKVAVSDNLTALYIFDGGILSDDDTVLSLNYFAREYWRGHHDIVYYKYHPGQARDARVFFNDKLEELSKENGIIFKEIDVTSSLEDIAFTLGNQLSTYFVISSVGFYSSMFGCKAFSSAEKFCLKYDKLRKIVEEIPSFFSEKILFI